MEVIHAAGTWTVTAADYMVWLYEEEPVAVLADRAGRVWSRLCLLADVDRTDMADESFGVDRPQVVGRGDVVEITVTVRTEAWQHKAVTLRCLPDRLELRARVRGTGTLGDVRLLGGRALLGRGACGTFRSSIGFAGVFNPAPTEPVQVVRPGFAPATLGVVGDASPGRLHSISSPPPLCLAVSRQPATHATDVPGGDWLCVGVTAPMAELRFTELRYLPVDDGFLLELDYDGHTTVNGAYDSPTVVLRPAADPWHALDIYRADLLARGHASATAPAVASWWTEPIFCGWGAQCAIAAWPAAWDVTAPEPAGADLARQDRYDAWLDLLAAHDVWPGTVVIDDRWQAAYGTGEPDLARWPDLRGWIKARHAAGQRVLLWWKAWDPEGLPADECVLDPAGRPVAADPGSPTYRARLAKIIAGLLGPDGVDADGLKVDFTQRAPAGRLLRRPGAPADAPWGIAALHLLLRTIRDAAKAAKPDALIITHTPHPGFADVTDMVRLNDILERDPAGAVVPAADQLAFRHAVVARSLPEHPVDTDQWPVVDRAAWREYVTAQAKLGVPSLYYTERIDNSREELTAADLALVAATWRSYREGRR